MVKNFGGNKQKKQGRKFMNAPRSNRLRYAELEGEIYACVSKLLGNGMANVISLDGTTFLCIIRNKFRGRGKRDSLLKVGTIVLVGERTWETKSDDKSKLSKCDLLEVYSEEESKRLKENVNENWNSFKSLTEGPTYKENDESDTLFEFTKEDVDDTIENEIMKEINEKNDNEVKIIEDTDFNIDDI